MTSARSFVQSRLGYISDLVTLVHVLEHLLCVSDSLLRQFVDVDTLDAFPDIQVFVDRIY